MPVNIQGVFIIHTHTHTHEDPGRRRLVPYTSSAAVHFKSSLRVASADAQQCQMDQRSGCGEALSDALSCLWNLSTMPFAMGWYAVVRVCFVPSNWVKAFHRLDSNCPPRSVVTVEGTPNRETHVCMKARATVSAEPSVNRPSCKPVDTGQQVDAAIRGRQQSHKVYVYVVETGIWCGEESQCGGEL